MRRVCHHDLDESLPALIVTYGPRAQKHWPLDRDILLLGRGRGCNLALGSPEVASVHCVIVRGQTGWSIRDCGSRVGTHVNGVRIDEVRLCDGDILQIGPFCFRAHLPAGAASPPAALDEEAILRLRRSRRNLALLALGLRRRLREEHQRQQLRTDQMTRAVQERLRQYEERAAQLAQAERELAEDREILEQEFQALQERVVRAEQELASRQAEVEADLQARWRQMQKSSQEAGQTPVRSVQPSAPTAETHRLDLRRQELAHYARHLHRTRQRLHYQDEALLRKQKELERLQAQLGSRPEPSPRSDAPHTLDRNGLCMQGV